VEPFVGRGAELAALRAEFSAAASGRPRLVLVEGDAGIGKSSLLVRFCAEVIGAHVLRGTGEESEQLLGYGVANQLLGGDPRDGGLEPMSVGTELLGLIDRAQDGGGVVVIVLDDLHWADERSARALLFAFRRLVADRVLILVTVRTNEMANVDGGWLRFVSGDPRASVVHLGGLEAHDVRALAELMNLDALPRVVASRIMQHTGGSPLYCRALLEELGHSGVRHLDGVMPVPRAFAASVLSKVSGLSDPAQRLVAAVAVLGERCALRHAVSLGRLDDPMAALDEAVRVGLLDEEGVGAGAHVAFVHPLTRAAVYRDLSPSRRRRLHTDAAALLPGEQSLGHRVTAAVGTDDALARDLEVATTGALAAGQWAQASAWLERAAELCSSARQRDRLRLDALDVLVTSGDVGRALLLRERIGPIAESALSGAVLGELDMLAGHGGRLEARLTALWAQHSPARDAVAASRAAMTLATFLEFSGRVDDALVWLGRATASGVAKGPVEMICRSRAAHCDSWLRGRPGLEGFSHLAEHPAEVPEEFTDALLIRGQAKMCCDELPSAITDLRTVSARQRKGIRTRFPSHTLAFLAYAEYRLGHWDDAVVHGELAVSLSHDADRTWDYPFVHAYAAFVPAARGDWETASMHVAEAMSAAEAVGAPVAIVSAATACAALANARHDSAGVLRATEEIRQTGRSTTLSRPVIWDWQQLEVEALIALGRLDDARRALAELDRAADGCDLAAGRLSAACLHGRLAEATGDSLGAEVAFVQAWQHASKSPVKHQVGWLGVTDGGRLRRLGRRTEALDRLLAARKLLSGLGARPLLQACDEELQASGVRTSEKEIEYTDWLTRSELAVGRLVASGRSNRDVAAELFISVKTVEFHLRNMYQKLGTRSRVVLAATIRGR
jgi:DNA-binding CsgD family transcriptional regulator